MFKLLATIILFISGVAVAAPEKTLQYQLTDSVVLVISSAPCAFPHLKEQYPLSAAALRIDGEKLRGCYKPQTADLIEIRWHKGDITVIPANAFLMKPVEAQPAIKADM